PRRRRRAAVLRGGCGARRARRAGGLLRCTRALPDRLRRHDGRLLGRARSAEPGSLAAIATHEQAHDEARPARAAALDLPRIAGCGREGGVGGHKGWIGVYLDTPRVAWSTVGDLIAD